MKFATPSSAQGLLLELGIQTRIMVTVACKAQTYYSGKVSVTGQYKKNSVLQLLSFSQMLFMFLRTFIPSPRPYEILFPAYQPRSAKEALLKDDPLFHALNKSYFNDLFILAKE